MRPKMPHLLLALFLLSVIVVVYISLRPPERWVVYYGDRLGAEAFLPYDVIVFDREGHPPLKSLKARHKTLLAYVSLGEAETWRDSFPWIKSRNLLLDTDAAWKGNPVIDARRPEWNRYLLDTVMPRVIAQGFDGIMLDTTDSLIWLEKNNAARYGGLQAAAVRIIKNIHARYPHLKIMLNRGFDILPQLAGDIDMSLAESIYPQGKTDVGRNDYRHYIGLLEAAKAQVPRLKIYTLDYYKDLTKKDVKTIYRAQRGQGFIPYVTLSGLQTVTPEPQ